MNNLLEIKNISKKYGNKVALDNVSLTLEGGHIYGLLGPNGSGKTTLIKLITGLLVQDNGEIRVCGEKVGCKSKSLVSYLPDQNYLEPNMNINKVIDYFVDFYEDFDKDRALKMLENLNINPRQTFKSMSKGTKEKVQLILVMSRRASI